MFRFLNKYAAKGGIKNKATIREAVNAEVLVKAKGLNNFPSAPIIVNTGIKLIIVVITAVNMAPETSAVALYTTVFIGRFSSFSSICRSTFSDRITPTSTIVPIAMAIPDKATMFASTLNSFIEIKTINTATGNSPEISTEALKLNTIIIITKMVIKISNVSASSSVPKVSWISSVLS